MNNIYVDELPESCLDCPCHNGEHGHCQLNNNSVIIYRPFDCPLKPLTDRFAEERKKVCERLDKIITKYLCNKNRHRESIDVSSIIKQVMKEKSD